MKRNGYRYKCMFSVLKCKFKYALCCLLCLSKCVELLFILLVQVCGAIVYSACPSVWSYCLLCLSKCVELLFTPLVQVCGAIVYSACLSVWNYCLLCLSVWSYCLLCLRVWSYCLLCLSVWSYCLLCLFKCVELLFTPLV